MLIKIDHPQTNQQHTLLTESSSKSSTSSTVENNNGFSANDYVVFGKLGQEKSEIVQITSVSGNDTIRHTTGPVFDHSARTPIFKIGFSQAEIYTASSESGTYSLLTTIDIDADEEYTTYDDTDGTTSTWYKIRYKNPTTLGRSEYSDAVQGTGYSEDSLYSITEEVLQDFGDPNADSVSRRTIYKHIRAGVRRLTVEVAKSVRGFRKQYKAEAMDGSTEYTVPDRMLQLYALRANYSGNSVADSERVEVFGKKEDFYDQSDYSDQDPHAYWEGDKVGLVPTTNSSGYIYWYYLDAPESMTDVTDTHGLPYGARDLLVLYALYRVWKTKNRDIGNSYKNDFKESLPDYIEFVSQNRQDISDMRVDVVFGEDLYE